MTAPAPPAELCGHRWYAGPIRLAGHADIWHHCAESAHPPTVAHRCRCGATTRED